MELIFEKSVKGRTGYQFPVSDVPVKAVMAQNYLRKEPAQWPEVTELDVVRHVMQPGTVVQKRRPSTICLGVKNEA